MKQSLLIAILVFFNGCFSYASFVVPDGSISTAKIAAQAVTQAKLAARATGTTVAAGGIAISASSGVFSTSSTGQADVTNLSVTITTTGRPVFVGLISDASPSICSFGGSVSGVAIIDAFLYLLRDATTITSSEYRVSTSSATLDRFLLPPSAFSYIDVVSAGTHTYKIQAGVALSGNALVNNVKLIAYEM